MGCHLPATQPKAGDGVEPKSPMETCPMEAK